MYEFLGWSLCTHTEFYTNVERKSAQYDKHDVFEPSVFSSTWNRLIVVEVLLDFW